MLMIKRVADYRQALNQIGRKFGDTRLKGIQSVSKLKTDPMQCIPRAAAAIDPL